MTEIAKHLADGRRGGEPDAWLRELNGPAARVATQAHPLLGRAAPDFTLSDHYGRPWNLRGRLERGPVVVVFYLTYGCSLCVHHLVELSADVGRYRSLGAEVVAVSADPPELTRARFEKYGAFDFPVLSDPGHAVAERYATFRPAGPTEPEELSHGTIVVGRGGTVRWANRGDTPFRNNLATLREVAAENKLPHVAVPTLNNEEPRKP